MCVTLVAYMNDYEGFFLPFKFLRISMNGNMGCNVSYTRRYTLGTLSFVYKHRNSVNASGIYDFYDTLSLKNSSVAVKVMLIVNAKYTGNVVFNLLMNY